MIEMQACTHIHTHINTCFMTSLTEDPLPKDALSRPSPSSKQSVRVCVCEGMS